MPKAGDLVAGKYVVDQLLGEGGMGAVFAATHRLTGKQVALKWMLPELARDEDAVQRFMREAQAAGRINHPNVVDVYDVGQHEESFFIVMELLRGEPLTSALSRRDLTVREVLDILLRAMRGVAAAHRQGVVHRDLKPDNIFLAYEEDGLRREPKVLDFGISKVSNEGQQFNPRLTRTGSVVGTPYYMSPEQIRGSDNLDRRADVYAFGVILYEALTGQVPFFAETYGALVLEIATGTPKTPAMLVPGLPLELSDLVMRAMARNAKDRFPDMESVIQALDPFLHDVPQAHPRTRPSRTPTGAPFRSTKTTAVSTPFTAEPPSEPLGRPNGKPALYVAGALAVIAVLWFVVHQARTPELPTAPATPITATQPPPMTSTGAPVAQPTPQPAPQPAPVTPQPFQAPSLPAGASTPGLGAARSPESTRGASAAPSNSTTGRAASSSRPSNPPARPWRPARRAEADTPKAPEPQLQLRTPAQPTGRRARSGPLSVEEF